MEPVGASAKTTRDGHRYVSGMKCAASRTVIVTTLLHAKSEAPTSLDKIYTHARRYNHTITQIRVDNDTCLTSITVSDSL
eukprot:scaffold214435_cov17-Prasinocladus_malaysianus.AAC.2